MDTKFWISSQMTCHHLATLESELQLAMNGVNKLLLINYFALNYSKVLKCISSFTRYSSIPSAMYFNSSYGSYMKIKHLFLITIFIWCFVLATSPTIELTSNLIFTVHGVKEVLLPLNDSKAVEIDFINPKILKNCTISLCKVILSATFTKN